jgi:hypothetical protein
VATVALIDGGGRGLVYGDFDGEHSLAALNLVAAGKIGFVHALAVDEGAVRGAEVSQENARRRYLKQTVVAREEAVFRQAEVCGLGTPYEKSIVLVEGKGAPYVGA